MKTSSSFSADDNFWNYLRRFLAGNPAIIEIAAIAFALADPKTPLWAKAILGAALAYFVMPLDAVPDIIPIGGMADDIAVAAAAVSKIGSAFVTDEHRRLAAEILMGR